MKVHGLVWCGVGFITGALCSRLFFVIPAQEPLAAPSSNSPVAVHSEVELNTSEQSTTLTTKPPTNPSKDTGLQSDSQIETRDVTTYSRDDHELSFDDLVSENQQLHLEIERLNAQLSVNQKLPDMAQMITESLALETRDPLFADEMELQVKDFVYQFGFDQDVELSRVNCKSTVCEISFTSKNSAAFDERTWRKVSDKLFETPWWKTFKASTSTSGDNQMTILATTYWPNEPKRVAK